MKSLTLITAVHSALSPGFSWLGGFDKPTKVDPDQEAQRHVGEVKNRHCNHPLPEW